MLPEAVNVEVPTEQNEAGLLLTTMGGDGLMVNTNVLAALVPQVFPAVTVILPDDDPNVALIVLVP